MSSLNTKKRIFDRYDVAALLCLAAAFLFLIVRAKYSITVADESLYLSLPFRFLKGDAMLADEWHVSQLSAFVLYLPVKLFVAIKGSTEGIIIFFRYTFVICQTIVSALIYLKLRKEKVGAIFAATVFLLHVPSLIFAMDYNSIGIMLVEILGLIFYSEFKNNNVKFLLSGFVLALLVTLCPAISLGYFVFTILVLVKIIFKKNNLISEKIFDKKIWLMITLGILPVFIMFCIFVLSRTTILNIIENLQKIIFDIEYQFISKQTPFVYFFQTFSYVKYSWIFFGIFAVIFIALFFDKKRKNHSEIYKIVGGIACVLSSISAGLNPEINVFTFNYPIAIFGLICYILTEKKNKKFFYSFYLSGFIYGVLICLNSDTGILGMGMALIVSSSASCVLIYNHLCESVKDKMHCYKIIVPIIVLISQLSMQIYPLANLHFGTEEYIRYENKSAITYRLENGPYKGVVTTEEMKNVYDAMIKDLTYIKDNCKGRVAVLDNYPWAYMYVDKPYGILSPWFIALRWEINEKDRLADYYSVHSDKKPEYIYICKFLYAQGEREELTEKIKNDICTMFECEIINGEIGYIIHIK